MLKVVPFLNFVFSVKISLLCFLRKLRKFLPPIHVLAFFENVDPITHACINSVEGRWKHVKRQLSAVNGSSAELLSGYLDEYLWRERYGKTLRSSRKSAKFITFFLILYNSTFFRITLISVIF